MDGDVQDLVSKTGVSIPLAAKIAKLVIESGASRLETEVALTVFRSLMHLLPISLVPGDQATGLQPDL